MNPPFTIRTAATVVQQALVETIDLALRRRAQVEDLQALRAYGGAAGTRGLPDRTLCYVRSLGVCYRFHSASRLADDGAATIAPPDRSGSGRWRRCELQERYGQFMDLPLCKVPPLFLEREPGFGLLRYAKRVDFYEGGAEEPEMLERLFAQRPSVLVKWEGDSPKSRSQKPGCLYFGPQRYSVLVIAQNNRPDASAMQGSEVPSDYDDSGPGINRMVGDLRYVLAGAQLGLGPYVERVEVGEASIVVESLAQRLFVAQLNVEAFCSVHRPEEFLQPVDVVSVQPLLAAGELPADAYVSEGLDRYQHSGLTFTLARGVAMVRGAQIVYEPAPLRLTAYRDSYLDLHEDGQLRPQVVALNAPAPPETGVLRLVRVRTALAVESVTYLAPSLTRWRTPYEI